MSRPTVWAFYRAYYGGDTIKLSIESILPQVDRVFVLYHDKPFYDITRVKWQGEEFDVPASIDNLVANASEMPRTTVQYDDWSDGTGQVPHLVNDVILPQYGRPDYLLYMSTDYLLSDGAIDEFLASDQHSAYTSFPAIHSWRYLKYALPFRLRHGAMLMDMSQVEECAKTEQESYLPFHHSKVGNTIDLSLASAPPTMLWKVLLRTAHAPLIPDDTPIVDWFPKWLNWMPALCGQEGEWGWCEGERQLGSPVEVDMALLPECARRAAQAQGIPDKWTGKEWRDIMREEYGQ